LPNEGRLCARSFQPYKFWQTGDALQNDYSSNPELQKLLQDLEKSNARS